MNRLRRLADRHPLTAAIGAVALVMGLMLSPVWIFGSVDVTDGTGRIEIVVTPSAVIFQSLAAALALAMVWLLGWGRKSTLIARSDPEGLKLSLWFNGALVVLVGVAAITALSAPRFEDMGLRLGLTLAFSLAIGVTEEVLFRGILMHGLRQRFSAGRALVICSLAFAVAHSVNAIWGQSLVLTVQQIGFTFVFGALLGAIALQTASLWPAIVLHALWDALVITGPLIQDPMVDQNDGATAPPLDPTMTLGVGLISAGIIAVIGFVALVVYRRWRRRVPASAIRRA